MNDGPPPRPRWVTVSLITAGVLLVALVVVLVMAGGHGPGRHF